MLGPAGAGFLKEFDQLLVILSIDFSQEGVLFPRLGGGHKAHLLISEVLF